MANVQSGLENRLPLAEGGGEELCVSQWLHEQAPVPALSMVVFQGAPMDFSP